MKRIKGLDIKGMIKRGELDSHRAGQLTVIHYYTNGEESSLSEQDLKLIRDTVKSPLTYNAYLIGQRQLALCETLLKVTTLDAETAIQKLAWIIAELKYTFTKEYKAPHTVVLTEEAYKRVGKEKRGLRLKRTYTLATLYRILAQDFINNPKDKAQKELIKELRKYPEDAKEGWTYGLDLIDDARATTSGLWRGWTYEANQHVDDLEGLDKIEEMLPEAHKLIVNRLKELNKRGLLSIDITSKAIAEAHNTPLKGSDLAKLEQEIPLIADLLNRTEYSLLDAYPNEGEDDEETEARYLHEQFMQDYIIIKNEQDIPKARLKDGIHIEPTPTDNSIAYGYIKGNNPKTLASLAPEHTIKNIRYILNSSLPILSIYYYWRAKAGELLGVDKTEEFRGRKSGRGRDTTSYYLLFLIYQSQLEGLVKDNYIKPEYREYTNKLLSLCAPLGNQSEDFQNRVKTYFNSNQDNRLSNPIEELIMSNPIIAEAKELTDKMTLTSIESTFESLKELSSVFLDEEREDWSK